MPSTFDAHVKNAQQAIDLLKTGQVTLISLDHNLGPADGTGLQVAKWIEEQAHLWGNIGEGLPPTHVRIHTASNEAKRLMKMALRSACEGWSKRAPHVKTKLNYAIRDKLTGDLLTYRDVIPEGDMLEMTEVGPGPGILLFEDDPTNLPLLRLIDPLISAEVVTVTVTTVSTVGPLRPS